MPRPRKTQTVAPKPKKGKPSWDVASTLLVYNKRNEMFRDPMTADEVEAFIARRQKKLARWSTWPTRVSRRCWAKWPRTGAHRASTSARDRETMCPCSAR